MAEIKKIIKRRKSTKNIKKITKTMSLIAAAKFKVAFRRVQTMTPYTEKLSELLADLMASNEKLEHPLTQERDKKKVSLVVITSNRGLCGAYNSKVLNQASKTLDELKEQGKNIHLHVVGKRGVNFFRNEHTDVEKTVHELGDDPSYLEVQPLAEKFISQYTNTDIDEVLAVYMTFQSASRQEAVAETILPFPMDDFKKEGAQLDYSTHPADSNEIFQDLVPKIVSANFYKMFLQSSTSEHVQRMIAMNAATDNAENLIKELTRLYNRARQAKITTELSEIMGTARSLNC